MSEHFLGAVIRLQTTPLQLLGAQFWLDGFVLRGVERRNQMRKHAPRAIAQFEWLRQAVELREQRLVNNDLRHGCSFSLFPTQPLDRLLVNSIAKSSNLHL